MLVLLVDTSLKSPFIALADVQARKLVDFEFRQHPQQAVSDLPDMLKILLARKNKKWSDVKGVIVATGPGSFTGIKIGLSFVYGLHRARPDLGIYSCSALSCFAASSSQENIWFLPATSTHGYFASKSEVGVINLERGNIDLESEDGASSRIDAKSLHRIGCLGSWPRLEELARSLGVGLYTTEVEQRGFEILNAMLQDFISNSCSFESTLPIARYLRKSAPEEKAAKMKQ